MDKHAFDTFLPLSTSSNAHRLIVLDFFELLAAVAAHSRTNGLGGRTLSRFAGWWALEHTGGKGFEPGYKSWASAADATCHMFFAYLRARAPTPGPGSDSISQLPRSLQTLVKETEYPPTSRTSSQSTVSSVVMVVDSVSPTPFAMLQRARDLEYRHHDHILRQFAEQQDPVKALTPECRRVLDMIAASSQSNSAPIAAPSDSTWADFESSGFSVLSNGNDNTMTHSRTTSMNTPNRRVSSRPNGQSWADFMNGGFSDEDAITTPPLSFPAKEYIPLINPDHSISPNRKKEEDMEPAELAGVERATMDETFWWVWMESLAPEEPLQRKASFGRCVLVELDINGSHWVAFEEQVRPAVQQGPSNPPEASPMAPEKKRNFLTKKTRTASGRQVSSSTMQRVNSSQQSPPLDDMHDTGYSSAQSTPAIGADKQALIQAAAAQLVQKTHDDVLTESVAQRRGRRDPDSDAKTVSVLSMQPVFVKDAAPALQWARKFDKEIRSGRTQDDQVSINSNVRSVSAPRGTLPPAYSSKENVASTSGAQNILDTPTRREASSTAGAEETPRKETMVPSPLNIPKRKPVGGDRQQDDAGRSSMQNVVSQDIAEQEPDIVQPEPDNVQQEPTTRPNLMKSKTGSRRGLRDLFKRKVTDPMAKSSSQRAVSSNSTLAGQQEQKPGMSRKTSLLGKKFGPAPPPASTGPSSQNRYPRSPSPVQEHVAEDRPRTPGQQQTQASNLDAGEPGPTMTSSSAVFGAGPGINVMDTVPDMPPASPAFSNFTSAATEPDTVRGETTSMGYGHSHLRNETAQSMPGYALDFDPGSPQRAQDVGASTQEGPMSLPSFKTRAAVLLNPQSEASKFPVRGSSMPFEASTTSFGSGQTRSDFQTPHDSSGTGSQEFHDANTAAHSHAPTVPTSSTAAEAEDQEDDHDSDGAPRPNTQERLNTASSRWAQIRQTAHARTASEATAAKNGQPSTPPWQQQDLKDSGLGSIGAGSGFSPGVFANETGAAGGNKGLGIEGIQGPGQRYAPEPRQNTAGAGEAEECKWRYPRNVEVHLANQYAAIEDRVARIKARVAALTQGVST